MRHLLLALTVALAPCALSFVASAATAAEFRIETTVHALDEEEPTSESITLFHDGVAYDFRDSVGRVTIFRPSSGDKPGRFLLLDENREVRTEIGADQVAALMIKLRRWAALQKDPFLRFAGDPVFKEEFDAATGELRLTSDVLSYRLVTMPVADSAAMAELRGFLDAYAQLHTMLEAGVPPGPRLKVNEAITRRSVVPVEIELTDGDAEEPALKSKHRVTWILSKKDKQRIDLARDHLAEYREVSNAEFRDGIQTAARK
ncbi:hypothetical protein Mal64_20230 [Pseudobythopirellula maris]|uniref:Uncharacterized protein n=1 Tax=Pseudobythopirellula maris TaxID=2527991 RepID=A0A5C5ZMZ6_9BACT|nr:hypothetical protein [Pseudobythopirellula maris]TWT88540.1 hypothetical protein Mal64_20230 [Pseudobythopirellula maris]